jgi:hypothetical protein
MCGWDSNRTALQGTVVDRRENFTISKAAAVGILAAKDDWHLVLSYLHHSGTYYGLMTADEKAAVRLFADGYGDLNAQVRHGLSLVTAHQLLWDWSHVRDSTDRAMARMARRIREWVGSYTDDR